MRAVDRLVAMITTFSLLTHDAPTFTLHCVKKALPPFLTLRWSVTRRSPEVKDACAPHDRNDAVMAHVSTNSIVAVITFDKSLLRS